jgi:hypothetical protein
MSTAPQEALPSRPAWRRVRCSVSMESPLHGAIRVSTVSVSWYGSMLGVLGELDQTRGGTALAIYNKAKEVLVQ